MELKVYPSYRRASVELDDIGIHYMELKATGRECKVLLLACPGIHYMELKDPTWTPHTVPSILNPLHGVESSRGLEGVVVALHPRRIHYMELKGPRLSLPPAYPL